MDITGIGAAATAISDIVGKFLPDKTQAEKDAFTLQLQAVTATAAAAAAQTEIDKQEAASTDPLEHWRGALGWVCVIAFFWTFVAEPVTAVILAALHNPAVLPKLDMATLGDLTFGMLGLGGMHVYQSTQK